MVKPLVVESHQVDLELQIHLVLHQGLLKNPGRQMPLVGYLVR